MTMLVPTPHLHHMSITDTLDELGPSFLVCGRTRFLQRDARSRRTAPPQRCALTALVLQHCCSTNLGLSHVDAQIQSTRSFGVLEPLPLASRQCVLARRVPARPRCSARRAAGRELGGHGPPRRWSTRTKPSLNLCHLRLARACSLAGPRAPALLGTAGLRGRAAAMDLRAMDLRACVLRTLRTRPSGA